MRSCSKSSTASESIDDDFEFEKPESSEQKLTDQKAKSSDPLRLPRRMKGVVVNRFDKPVEGASVTLNLHRLKDLFDASERDATEKWSSFTDAQGAYSLLLDEVEIEPDDELLLHVTLRGLSPLVSSIRFKETPSWKLPK